MYKIIIEQSFFRSGKSYDAIISTHKTEIKAALEKELFLISNPNYKNHSIIIIREE